MSAITGIFYRDGRTIKPELIKKMNNRLSHRGPDGSSVWVDGSVALGHQMLWTTPESLQEKLPFHEEKTGLVVTADARIDNRKELSKKLNIENNKDVSDSYFIMKSYEKWGEKCPKYLLGDFAFAIWDENKEKLFCARDHMGVKPFYYYLDNKIFAFATEIKAIFSDVTIPKKLNELRVADYLVSLFEDKEITFYEGINRLPAACNLTINFDKSNLNEYWFVDIRKEIILDSDQEYSEAFRNIFTESVNCRLRSAFPIGSMLSGGLDSSSIVCTARKILSNDHTLNTFSAVFDDVPQCDERYFIDSVLKGGNITPNYVNADKISPLSNINEVLWHLDEPLYSPNLFIHWNIYIEAQKRGIRVILDGYDGDSTISHGEGFLAELASTIRWRTLFQEIRGISKNLGVNMNRLLLYQVLAPFIPSNVKYFLRYIMGFINGFQLERNMIKGIGLNEDFISKNDILKRYNSLLKPKNTKNSREYHHFKISSGIQQFVLEVLDKSAAAFSIEPRYPFFDSRLIEFCLALPTEQKLFKGWDRIVLRRAMDDILPPKIQWRPRKSNLGPNFERSFSLYEKDDKIKKVFLTKTYNIKNYMDINYLNNIYSIYNQGNEGKNIYTIWKAVNLALWLDNQKFVTN